MILNENIHEFDNLEKRINKKNIRKVHSFKEWFSRIIYLIDAKLYEKTYKEEYEKQNKIIDRQNLTISKLQKEIKKYEKQNMGR